MPTVAELGQKVKLKYPGAYDGLPDDELGRRVKQKYPGAYDSFTDTATPSAVASSASPAPSTPTEGRSEFGKGFASGKNMFGSSMQFLGALSGIDTLRDWGEAINKGTPEEAAALTPKIAGPGDIRSPGDALDWVAYTVGNLVPSMGASVAGGIAGGAAGTALAGPPGGVVGGVAGAGGISYLLNGGEVYANLIEKGVSRDKARGVAAAAGLPMALLDVIVPAKVAGKVLWQPVKKAATKATLKTIAKETGKSILEEGVTEGAQEALGAGAESTTGVGKFFTPETASRVLNAAAAGGLGGLLFGGAGEAIGAARARRQPPPGGPPSGGALPAGPGAPPAAPQPPPSGPEVQPSAATSAADQAPSAPYSIAETLLPGRTRINATAIEQELKLPRIVARKLFEDLKARRLVDQTGAILGPEAQQQAAPPSPEAANAPATGRQRAEIYALRNRMGFGQDAFQAVVREVTGQEGTEKLTGAQAGQVLDALISMRPPTETQPASPEAVDRAAALLPGRTRLTTTNIEQDLGLTRQDAQQVFRAMVQKGSLDRTGRILKAPTLAQAPGQADAAAPGGAQGSPQTEEARQAAAQALYGRAVGVAAKFGKVTKSALRVHLGIKADQAEALMTQMSQNEDINPLNGKYLKGPPVPEAKPKAKKPPEPPAPAAPVEPTPPPTPPVTPAATAAAAPEAVTAEAARAAEIARLAAEARARTEAEKPALVTDPAQVQEIRNSIAEGETILRGANQLGGKQYSETYIESVRRSIEKSKARIAPAPTESQAQEGLVANSPIEQLNVDAPRFQYKSETGQGELAPRLPTALAGAKPRYAFAAKQFDLEFESDLDKAAYIAAQSKRSKADAQYVAFASQHAGMTPAGVRMAGVRVRRAIKELARETQPGTLRVPQVLNTQPAAEPVESPLEDLAGRARERLDNLFFDEAGTFNLGALRDAATVGAQKIASGFEKYSAWSKEMLRELGLGVRRYLMRIWTAARDLLARYRRSRFGSERESANSRDSGSHGPIFTEYRHNAKGAIAKLQQLQDGEAVGALHHPDVGDIDLIWGEPGTAEKQFEDGYGLAHVAAKHEDLLPHIQETLEGLPVKARTPNRIQLWDEEHRAAVRLDWDGKEKRWLLTMYKKPSTPERSTGVPGTPVAGGGGTPPPAAADSSIPRKGEPVKGRLGNERGSISLRPAPAAIPDYRPRRSSTSMLGDVADILFRSAGNVIERQGEAGKALKWFIDEAHDMGDVQAGQRLERLQESGVTKLKKADRLKLVDVLRGREAGTPELQQVAAQVTGITDEMASEAERLGVEILAGGHYVPFVRLANYFPQVIRSVKQLASGEIRKDVIANLVHLGIKPNEASAATFLDDYLAWVDHGGRRDSLIAYLIESGQAATRSKAIAMLDRTQKTTPLRHGSLEFAREVDLPFWDPDPGRVLPHWLAAGSERLESIRVFGQKGDKGDLVQGLIENIREAGGDANYVGKAVERILGKVNDLEKGRRFSAFVRTVQGFKLGLAAIPNATQGALNSLLYGDLQAVGAGFKGILSKEGRKFGMRSGASTDSVLNEMTREVGSEWHPLGMYLKAVGFTATERLNRTFAANAGANWAGRMARRLRLNPRDTFARQALEELGIDPAAVRGGQLTGDQILLAAKKFSDITQFRSRPQDLPLWASHPIGKIFFQFKTFVYGQARLVGRTTVEEMRRGHYGRAARNLLVLATVFPLSGEAIGALRRLITGRKRDPKDETLLLRWWDGMTQSGALGMLGDLFEAITYPAGLLKWGVGPSASQAYDIAEPALRIPFAKYPMKQAGVFGGAMLKQVPLAGQLRRRLLPSVFGEKKKSATDADLRRLLAAGGSE